MSTILDISYLLALTSQLVTVLIVLRTCLRNRTAAIGFFATYIVIEAIRSTIGFVLASLAIHNLSFYIYSDFFSILFFILFTYSITIDKSMRKIVLLCYLFYLIYFGFALINPDKHELLFQFKMAMIIETIASAMILHSRLKEPNGLRFLQDPWSVIAFTLVSSLSLSLLFIAASAVASFNHFSPNLIIVFYFGNSVSVILRYAIVSHQLLRIPPSKIAG